MKTTGLGLVPISTSYKKQAHSSMGEMVGLVTAAILLWNQQTIDEKEIICQSNSAMSHSKRTTTPKVTLNQYYYYTLSLHNDFPQTVIIMTVFQMSHWLFSGNQNCREWCWREDPCMLTFKRNASNIRVSHFCWETTWSDLRKNRHNSATKWDEMVLIPSEHTNTPTHTWTTQRLSTSKSSLSVFIMWRASCYPITRPLFFVHWKQSWDGKETGRNIKTTISFRKYPCEQVIFHVMPRESRVVKSPSFGEKKIPCQPEI